MGPSKLKDNFKGSIVTDAATVEAASTDASIFKVIPVAVATPTDVEDIKTLVLNTVQLANGGIPISITARAAGTCMSGGSLTEGVAVDMKPDLAGLQTLM